MNDSNLEKNTIVLRLISMFWIHTFVPSNPILPALYSLKKKVVPLNFYLNIFKVPFLGPTKN